MVSSFKACSVPRSLILVFSLLLCWCVMPLQGSEQLSCSHHKRTER